MTDRPGGGGGGRRVEGRGARHPHERPVFVLRYFADEDGLVAARWWNEAFRARGFTTGRRTVFWIAGGALALSLAPFVCAIGQIAGGGGDDDLESAVDALELQRREGWDVGQKQTRLALGSITSTDADGTGDWKLRMYNLAAALEPADARLVPYYVPTLFQALSPSQPGAQSLRDAIGPVQTAGMRTAFDQARALASLLDGASKAGETAVLLDLPGPESVAAAAALAPRMTPVFLFDNWPHPLGVVPSHQTLGAALYHLPAFLRAAQQRGSAPAPALFVLDDARLNPYRDQASQFDNRYLAKVPPAPRMVDLGVRRLLYVRPAGARDQELDDLNDDFVAYRNAGIEVRLVSLGDFQEGPAPISGAGGATGTATAATTTTTTITIRHHYYWGGSPSYHALFWSSYGWPAPQPAPAPRGRRVAGAIAPPAATVRPPPTPRTSYRPTPRTTMFSSFTVGGLAGVGRQKPSGFGRVSIRTDRGTGAVTGVAAGRSGSFGRSRSSWSG